MHNEMNGVLPERIVAGAVFVVSVIFIGNKGFGFVSNAARAAAAGSGVTHSKFLFGHTVWQLY